MSKSLMSSARLTSLVSCLTLLALSLPAAQPTIALPPFIITGRITDYRGAGIQSAEVRVRKGAFLLYKSNASSAIFSSHNARVNHGLL